MKRKIFLLWAVLVFVFTVTSCEDDSWKFPKWELPQPMDTLLLGSWEQIEGDVINFGGTQIITFYENNKYINKITDKKGTVEEYEYRWSVNGDTLVMPDFCDNRTRRFNDYIYNVSSDGKQLTVELIHYSWVGKGYFTMEPIIAPFEIDKGTFKKLEK